MNRRIKKIGNLLIMLVLISLSWLVMFRWSYAEPPIEAEESPVQTEEPLIVTEEPLIASEEPTVQPWIEIEEPIETKAPIVDVLSSDSSLRSLTVSDGILYPAFRSTIYEYSLEVANVVTSIKIGTAVNDQSANVSSIKGNTNIPIGTSRIQIVCEAANGTSSEYTIMVTRAQRQDSQLLGIITTGGEPRFVSSEFSSNQIPEGFEPAALQYQGSEVQGLKFQKYEYYLLYLVDENNRNGKFYHYNRETESVSEFVRLCNVGNQYIIVLDADDSLIPDNFVETLLSAEGFSVRTWKLDNWMEEEQQSEVFSSRGDFYIVYGFRQNGTSGWYLYDAAENTVQRLIDTGNAAVHETIVISQSEKMETALTNSLNELQDAHKKQIKKYRTNIILITSLAALLGIGVAVLSSIFIIRFLKDKKWNRKEKKEVLDLN